MQYLNLSVNTLLPLFLGFYLLLNLQWYNYKLERVILKHHKIKWHLLYFVLPITLFYTLDELYFLIYFYLLFMPLIILWYKKIDKKLVFTMRAKRFLFILFFVVLLEVIICFISSQCNNIGLLLPIIITYFITSILEKIFFLKFKIMAQKNLKKNDNLIIIAITASYGKTSIKNYLHQVLCKNYNTYMTPRSINTIGGIIQDINNNLKDETNIYIVEAGAREKGDIFEIVKLLQPHYCILGSVGEQHLEYFKTLDNIISTKIEILQSSRLRHGFVHNKIPLLKYNNITKFPDNLSITSSNLDGISFSVKIDNNQHNFSTPILGSFNAQNLCAVVLMAHKIGMSIKEIKVSMINLKSVSHRLEKIQKGNKIILDDSYNGNLEGMLEAIELCLQHDMNVGKKIIITPGLIESTIKANTILAKKINEVFDLVILTGKLNLDVLSSNIDKNKRFVLKDKEKLVDVLGKKTDDNDLVLFANDAPNFI